MPCADGNSLLVEDGPDVVRVDAVQQEREHTRLFSCRANQTNTRNRCNRFGGICERFVFIGSHIVHPQTIHIIDGCTQADGTRHMGRARFKFVRQFVVDCLLECHRTDHVTAALVRRHGIQQSGFAVQNADARRPV